jgi:hypothetical protein
MSMSISPFGYYEASSLWIGTNYRSSSNPLRGTLVIGHSTYATPDDDPPGIVAWIQGGNDLTFKRFLNCVLDGGITGIHSPSDLFRSIAFYNFVPWSLGPKTRSPKPEEYKQAAQTLPGVINQASPRAIFVFGKRHQKYSLPIIKAYANRFGVPYRATVHPIQDKHGLFLPAWKEFIEMLDGLAAG